MSELDRRMLLGAAAGAAGVMALSRRAKAGPLDPPQGPIGSTGRTSVQIEPRIPICPELTPGDESSTFAIRAPGSYCLIADIVGEQGKVALKIELPTPGVVQIDMNGFAIRQGASPFLTAMLFTGAPCRCLTLADGYFVGWGLDCFNVDFADIDDVTVLGGEVGLRIRRSACIFDAEVTGVTGSGISWLRDPTAATLSLEVSDCVVRSCGSHGLSVGGDWTGGTGSLSVDDCDFISCGGDGVSVSVSGAGGGGGSGGGLWISACDLCCRSCTGHGLLIEAVRGLPGALGVQCVGEVCDVDCVGNGGCGIRCSNVVCDVDDCMCTHNGADGMQFEACRGLVTTCSAGHSTLRGISISGFDPVTSSASLSECCDCTCYGNAVGIFADASVTGVCFEDNSLVNNSLAGMQIDGTGNLVTGNACRGMDPATPPFQIAQGNMVGPIVTGPDALVVSSNPHVNCAI